MASIPTLGLCPLARLCAGHFLYQRTTVTALAANAQLQNYFVACCSSWRTASPLCLLPRLDPMKYAMAPVSPVSMVA